MFPPPSDRTPGWGVKYFAETLAEGIKKVEPAYRMYSGEDPIPEGMAVDDPLKFARERSDEFIVLAATPPLPPHLVAEAFGPSGTSGNEGAVRALANGLLDLYASLITWGLTIKAAVVSYQWTEIYDALGNYPRAGLLAIRAFSDSTLKQATELVEALQAGYGEAHPLNLELTLATDEEAYAAFMKAGAKLKAGRTPQKATKAVASDAASSDVPLAIPFPTERGVGWGPSYFGQALAAGLSQYESEYRAYLGERPLPASHQVQDPQSFAVQQLEQFEKLFQRSTSFDASLVSRAFGPGSLSGDEEALRTLVGGLVDMYVSLITWGLSVKCASVPPSWREVYSALGDYPLSAMASIRAFSDTFTARLPAWLEAVRAGKVPEQRLAIPLNLKVAEKHNQALMEAMQRFQASG